MKRVAAFLFAVAVVLMLSMQATAALHNRGTDSLGNRLIYDDDLNITWYDYTESAAWYSGWQIATDWAADLTVGFSGKVYDDWRLPTSLNQDGSGPCSGFNCISSEMGHLYYTELGNPARGPINNTGEFQDLQRGFYWSGTKDTARPDSAWIFGYHVGFQTPTDSDGNFAIAVRSGDVAVAPEPISSILFVTGGTLLAGRRYMRKRK